MQDEFQTMQNQIPFRKLSNCWLGDVVGCDQGQSHQGHGHQGQGHQDFQVYHWYLISNASLLILVSNYYYGI